MGAVLIVHPDVSWMEKCKSEISEKGEAPFVFHSSLKESIDTLRNSALPISAIYLSVKNQDYSIFSALDSCIAHRPVTPVFLLDQPDIGILPSLGVKSAFPEGTALKQILSPIKRLLTTPGAVVTVRTPSSKGLPHHVSVPTSDFFNLQNYPEDVFIIDQDGDLNLFAAAGSPVDLGYLLQASKYSPLLHLRETRSIMARTQLKSAKKQLLELSGISEAWVQTELFVEARNLLKEIRAEMPTDKTIELALGFLNRFFQHLSNLDLSRDSVRLHEFMSAAAKTDRSLVLLPMALLFCSHFKFEKAAIIEIFGVATLLQDVSLIHSPFGNIADLPSGAIPMEARTFHHNHPVHSADLLASSTNLSSVTLQVIRQHHETRDRTGYPHRVGGPMLHPMAEALSLLNQYFDLREVSPSTFVTRLKKEVFPHYSENMTHALNEVILKIHGPK